MRGTIYGPYKLQYLELSLPVGDAARSIKLWFVFKPLRPGTACTRFEVTFDQFYQGRYRGRSDHEMKSHAAPTDLSGLPSCSFPRHPGDTRTEAAKDLIPPDILAEIAALYFGESIPIKHRERWLAAPATMPIREGNLI